MGRAAGDSHTQIVQCTSRVMGLNASQIAETLSTTQSPASTPASDQAQQIQSVIDAGGHAAIGPSVLLRGLARHTGQAVDLSALPPDVAQMILQSQNATMQEVQKTFSEMIAKIGRLDRAAAFKREKQNGEQNSREFARTGRVAAATRQTNGLTPPNVIGVRRAG